MDSNLLTHCANGGATTSEQRGAISIDADKCERNGPVNATKFGNYRSQQVSEHKKTDSRVRLKKVAKLARRVAASACSFMKPTIGTSEVSASWTTAGIRPFNFA
jgi:hypothetical protein